MFKSLFSIFSGIWHIVVCVQLLQMFLSWGLQTLTDSSVLNLRTLRHKSDACFCYLTDLLKSEILTTHLYLRGVCVTLLMYTWTECICVFLLRLLIKSLNAAGFYVTLALRLESITKHCVISLRWAQRLYMCIIRAQHEWAGSMEWGTYPQPLVDALPVELMAAGQDSQQLAGLKITHTHHTPATQQVLACQVRQHKKKPVV